MRPDNLQAASEVSDSPTIATTPGKPDPTSTTKPGAAHLVTTLAPIIVIAPANIPLQGIDPSLGARIFQIDQSMISNQGEGENSGLNDIILRAPGVSRESGGQFHVRGEDYGLQYRLDGILLPEGIASTFGQPFDSRLIDTLTLITGALPAQYGLRTAGVVDMKTKSGSDLEGQNLSLFGGSHGTLHSAFSSGGKEGDDDYFVTGTYLQNQLGIENATSGTEAIHDRTRQYQGFAVANHQITPGQKLSFILSGLDAHFQIPNAPGATPVFAYQGRTTFDSAQLNRNQIEQNYYGILAYRADVPDFTFQISQVNSYNSTHYQPDTIGDLIFTGSAGNTRRDLIGNSLQLDSTWYADANHTVRSGMTFTTQLEETHSGSLVFPTNPAAGNVLSDVPFNIDETTDKRGYTYGLYLQDEWAITKLVTINYGGRMDFVNAYVNQGQFSPRLNVVFKPTEQTTLHAGYARLFSPPLLEYLRPSTLARFVNTTNAPSTLLDDAPSSARAHVFDAGLNSEISPGLTAGIDAYYQFVHNMQDETQLGDSLIFTPFSYKEGYKEGVETSFSYQKDALQIYTNVAVASTEGRDINSSQGLFTSNELAYISSHYIRTDYDQLVTISSGAAFTWEHTVFHADFLFGSGMYGGFGNSDQLESHGTLNLGVSHTLLLPGNVHLVANFDIINVLDSSYLLHDAGIGATSNQYGERRGFFGSVSCAF